jgi:hypothetical protein
MNAEQIEQLEAQRDARTKQLCRTRDAMLKGIAIVRAEQTVAFIISKLLGRKSK